jgi:hypothetical protein
LSEGKIQSLSDSCGEILRHSLKKWSGVEWHATGALERSVFGSSKFAADMLLSPSEVEITSKRNGKVVGVLHLSVTPDGKSIHGVFQNKENNTSSSCKLRKVQ